MTSIFNGKDLTGWHISRTTYQIELQVPAESTGNLFGERMRFSQPQYIGEKIPVSRVWKTGEWNSLRIRMVGEAPHVTVWVNGTQLYELQMPRNDQIAGVYGGMIGLQLHWTATYAAASGTATGTRPWQLQRLRNIAIREIDSVPAPAREPDFKTASARSSSGSSRARSRPDDFSRCI